MKPETCPHCGANLVGDPIPEEHQEVFGGKTHWSRLIGVSDGDSVMWHECPDCGGRVEREPAKGGAYRDCVVVLAGLR